MKFIIIGGDAAGMSAAMQIVRNSTGNEVITFERGSIYSYGQCGLPYAINGEVKSTEDLIARKPETFEEKYGIRTNTYHEVTKVDCEKKIVFGTNLQTGEAFEESYDRLLIASGASPVLPPWENKDLDGIFSLKTIPDAEAIMEYMNDDTKDVTLIGGGYISLEMAESLVSIGKRVSLIERGDQLAKIFDWDMAALIHTHAEEKGVQLHFGESVEGFEGDTTVETVLTDKGSHETDLVIAAIGVVPNTAFMDGTGVSKSINGAISVNRFMETSIKDIYAAGDCATQYHRIKQRDDHIPLGTHANKQGQIAGLNMIDQPKAFQGIVGTSILKFFDLTLGKTGLSEREAASLHLPYDSVTIESTHAAGYYADSRKDTMTLKLVYNPETLQLLGGQIIGKKGIDKRIDVLATALYHEMTTEQLLDLDLSYAPPYNSVWDPLQQAARKAKRRKA
ncbi:FAD-dependent oxidoreductase [Thalassobacillus hwangdonensis]|uniref:FAD-dependent oxidoreductase n=1 Tax=Thalassobacillus hwangdonensis TaxID=546108 RepID=A0ABW3L565_9BACI